jgi:hypothetical protein
VAKEKNSIKRTTEKWLKNTVGIKKHHVQQEQDCVQKRGSKNEIGHEKKS